MFVLWFFHTFSRWWFGGLWQDGVRKEEGRKSESVVSLSSHLCIPRLQCFTLSPFCICFPTLVEQEEWEGGDVSTQSVHRWKPEAGSVPGRTGEQSKIWFLFQKILHYFIVNVQNQDKKNTIKVRQMRVKSSGNGKIFKCTWQKSNNKLIGLAC